jgi:NAD(P)-dependent dehydrogenase (short-subunit alcohol dehydrogenase family)
MAQKIAFITGGNRGIGFQTALDLKDEGVKVVIGSRDPRQGEQAVEKLRAAGVDANVLEFDITKPADYQAAYDYFNSRYGHLDILVNNAGIAAGTFPGTGPSTPLRKSPRTCSTRSLRPTFSRPSRSPKRFYPCSRRALPAASSTSPAFSVP